MLEGHIRNDELYNFPPLNESPFVKSSFQLSSIFNNHVLRALAIVIDSKLPSVWHLKPGHPRNHSLKLVLQNYNIPYNNKSKVSFVQLVIWVRLIDFTHMLHTPFILSLLSLSLVIYGDPLLALYL